MNKFRFLFLDVKVCTILIVNIFNGKQNLTGIFPTSHETSPVTNKYTFRLISILFDILQISVPPENVRNGAQKLRLITSGEAGSEIQIQPGKRQYVFAENFQS